MVIQQLSVFLENKAGTIVPVAKILSDNGIDMRAMSIADSADFGILRIIVDDPEKTKQVLAREKYIYNVTPVLAVEVEDHPGSLVRILTILSDAKINLEYAYAFITRKTDSAYMVFRVDDPDRTVKILQEADISMASQDEIYSL
jgi:hypothetical protein